MNALVRGELLKIRTTRTWWGLLAGLVAATGLGLAFNTVLAIVALDAERPQPSTGMSAADTRLLEQSWEVHRDVAGQAATLYTSGQFIGLLLVMVLGIMVMTGEFTHRTATTTFLTMPVRHRVIRAKLAAAAMVAGRFWLLSTVLNLAVGAIVLHSKGIGPQFGQPAVLRAVLLNLLAYGIWAMLGVAIGVLFRGQAAAIVTACLTYLIGTQAAQMIFGAAAAILNWQWALKAQVLVPSIASQVMTAGVTAPGNPPPWVGAVVLLGYAVVAGGLGVRLIQRRDIH